MEKRITILFSLLFLATFSFAQLEEIAFVKQFGSTNPDYDIHYTLDHSNNLITTTLIEYGVDLNVDGNVYTGVGEWCTLISKFAEDGTMLWSNLLKAESGMYNDSYGVVTNSIGEIYIAGVISGGDSHYMGDTLALESGSLDGFLLKLDADGSLIWKKVITGDGGKAIFSIALDHQENILISGYYEGSIILGDSTYLNSSNTFSSDGFLAKLDANGNFLNSLDFKSPPQGNIIYIENLKVNSANEILASVNVSDGSVLSDGTTFTGTSKGVIKWNKDLSFNKYFSIEANNFWIANYELSPNDDIVISATAADTFYVDGQMYIPENLNQTQVTMKIDGGTFQSHFVKMYGEATQYSSGIYIDDQDNIYTTISYVDTLTIDGIQFFPEYEDNMAISLLRLDNNGNLLWFKDIAIGRYVAAGFMNADKKGDLYIEFSMSMGVDIGNVPVTSFGDSDLFIVKLTDQTLSIDDRQALDNTTIEIYPNPTSAMIHVSAEHPIQSIRVLDAKGRRLLTTSDRSIDLSGFNDGIYLFDIVTDEGRMTKRIIKGN